MIDLTRAIYCIKRMKKEGNYRREKIGIIAKTFPGDFSMRQEGDVILFRHHLFPDDSEICMGEYMGMEQKPTGKVTIETPLTKEEIDKRRLEGSFITTIGTMTGVPLKYIHEVKID